MDVEVYGHGDGGVPKESAVSAYIRQELSKLGQSFAELNRN